MNVRFTIFTLLFIGTQQANAETEANTETSKKKPPIVGKFVLPNHTSTEQAMVDIGERLVGENFAAIVTHYKC